jgi:hypothetical protein
MINKLNQLLENAKHENPLLTESDIISVINNRSLLVKRQSFFTLKNILIMSVISSIIVGLWMVFYPIATTNLTESTQPNSPKNKEQVTEKLEVNNLLANAENTTTTTTAKANEKSEQVVDSTKKLPEINNKPATKLFDPIPFTPLFNENPIDDNRNYFDKDGYLILTNEELAKLGIITDGNVLKYENVTDTFFTFKENGKITTQHTSFKLNVEEHGSRSTSLGISKDTVIIKKSLPFWAASLSIINFPIAINTTNKKDSSHQIIEFLNGNSYENDFLKEIESMLVPIVVHLKSVPHKYSSDLKLIFWFKTEPKFYEVLSNDIANAVEHKYGTSTESDYKKILYKYRGFSRKTAQKGFDSLTVSKLKPNYIELNKEQLNSIGIKLTKKGFHYKSYQNIDNKTQKLDVKVKKVYTSINNNNNLFQRKRKNTPFKAVAKTDVSINHISYLMQFSDSISYSDGEDISEKYFRENVQKLIPIKVNAENVIWFEPTEELNQMINIEKENKNYIKKIDLTKVKLLEFNVNELLNLGIKLEQNGVLVPMYSFFPAHDNLGLISSLFKNKNGNETKFDTFFRTEKPISPKTYPAPKIITDINGFKFLSFKDGTENSGSVTFEVDSNFKFDLNSLLPIKISNGNASIIAWYEPNYLFLSSLPNSESTEIKTEYNAISNNLPAPSCKYFEVCQNVTGKINSYLAYPNPAEQTLNIEIDLAEERQLEFIVTDITGKIIKTLNQNLKQAKGIQTYTYQIGELTEGMYLLIITTDKGEKVSTRIVKK